MIIGPKTPKVEKPLTTEEKLFKLLESIDWKLWEMYNIMKAQAEPQKPGKVEPATKSKVTKKVEV